MPAYGIEIDAALARIARAESGRRVPGKAHPGRNGMAWQAGHGMGMPGPPWTKDATQVA